MKKKKTINLLEKYFDRLWPINRSIVSPGFRESLDIISEIIPFNRQKFKTGDKIYDWTIPKEWKVNKAYIIDPNGKKRCDFSKNNLHLISHSSPYFGELPLSKLKNIFTPTQIYLMEFLTSHLSLIINGGFVLQKKNLKVYQKEHIRLLLIQNFIKVN